MDYRLSNPLHLLLSSVYLNSSACVWCVLIRYVLFLLMFFQLTPSLYQPQGSLEFKISLPSLTLNKFNFLISRVI